MRDKNEDRSSLLSLDTESLNTCVSCGLCLPHCPTYRATGDERLSPRGRIGLMRSAEKGELLLTSEWIESMDTCVQCRGCETACPSDVPFGTLIADTKNAMNTFRTLPIFFRFSLKIIANPILLRIATLGLVIFQKFGFFKKSGYLPKSISFRKKRKNAVKNGDVILFTGCIMESWTPQVHDSTIAILNYLGLEVLFSGEKVGCCGALYEHSGLRNEAKSVASKVIKNLEGDEPILVNSAGCGAMLKEYGKLLGSEEAELFTNRVFDIHEWIVDRYDFTEILRDKEAVIVQDPCHLLHVQKSHQSVRQILSPFMDIVELNDDGLCCGAGGAFSMLQKELSVEVRSLKEKSISETMNKTGAKKIVSANPGCVMHLQAAGLEVNHPLELLEDYLPYLLQIERGKENEK